ncbi:cytochrome P450 [Delitschia confertaspora ATCC 74209]|uniref:Cytochrome P450 n=1 Tax=Delitschia confertaspora ATCC 74209 TaxID=1513339 RepID=A0A9P4JRM9_9PLEO|nr:cytochrome P450 [Delitschia confertaspora ATCC 74209]
MKERQGIRTTVQKQWFLLFPLLISVYTWRNAPQYTISGSIFWNTVALFLIQYLVKFGWTVIVYPLFFSPLRHLSQPPGAGLILGHFPIIFKLPSGEPQREWVDTIPNDGVLYYRWLFNQARVLVTTPKALAEVLVQKNYEFVKPERVRDSLGRLLGVGILLAEGDEHRRQRKALMPAFSFRHVKDLYPTFWSKSRELIDAISATIKEAKEQGKPDANVIEIRDWASRVTLDLIGVAGLGVDFNAIRNPENNELYQTYRKIFSPSKVARILQLASEVIPTWILRLLPVKRNDEMKDAVMTIKKVARELVVDKRARFEKGGSMDVDILSVAIESGGFSDDDLVNQIMTFLAAGHETTASAFTWAIYLLCKHPEVQTRLREEIRNGLPLLQDPDAKIEAKEIDHLQYLNAVINEAMRVFPPVALTLRVASHDTTIQGHFIPKDTTVIIAPWAINTASSLWGEDAKEFNPDRWMGVGKANSGGSTSNYAYTTFIHGPRSCIGKDFSKAEFACLLAQFIGHFETELKDPNWKMEIQGGITSKPKGGLWVRVREVELW